MLQYAFSYWRGILKDINSSSKLVHGIGVKGMVYPARVLGKDLLEYRLWGRMLERCNSKYWTKYPTYLEASTSTNFNYYPYFYEWCHAQIGFGNKDEGGKSWHLDKDLLVKGNKLYSEDTCVFVPHRINCLLTNSRAKRGSLPVGVCLRKRNNKFYSSCGNGVVKAFLGDFDTAQEAFLAYKTYKESLIKQVAEQYKHQLDPRAYEALLNYTVEITD